MTSNWAVPWHPNKWLLIEYASKAKANNCSCWGGFNTTTYYSAEEQETLNFLYHWKVRKDLRTCCLDICWGSWVSSLPSWSEACRWRFQSWLQGKVWKGASDHILAQCNTIIKPMACKNKFNKVRKIFLNDIWLLTGSPASSSSSIGQSSNSLSSQASHGVMRVVLILGLKKNPYGLTLLLFISILVILLLIQLIFVVSLGMASGWTISYKRMAIIWWDGWNSSKMG